MYCTEKKCKPLLRRDKNGGVKPVPIQFQTTGKHAPNRDRLLQKRHTSDDGSHNYVCVNACVCMRVLVYVCVCVYAFIPCAPRKDLFTENSSRAMHTKTVRPLMR